MTNAIPNSTTPINGDDEKIVSDDLDHVSDGDYFPPPASTPAPHASTRVTALPKGHRCNTIKLSPIVGLSLGDAARLDGSGAAGGDGRSPGDAHGALKGNDSSTGGGQGISTFAEGVIEGGLSVASVSPIKNRGDSRSGSDSSEDSDFFDDDGDVGPGDGGGDGGGEDRGKGMVLNHRQSVASLQFKSLMDTAASDPAAAGGSAAHSNLIQRVSIVSTSSFQFTLLSRFTRP